MAAACTQEASFRPLTSDHRALRVGDSLTVLVFENSSASTSAGTDTERDVDIGLGVTVTRPTREATGSLVFNNEFSGTGKLQRSGKLAAQITVTVRSVDPNGDLRVAGRQLIAVNEDKQEIVLAGRVRPQDISESNTVVSSRLADATISYVGEGLLARAAETRPRHPAAQPAGVAVNLRRIRSRGAGLVAVLHTALLIPLLVAALVSSNASAADTKSPVRLKDLGQIEGWRENMLVGYGLVTGLAGTGDSQRNQATRQSIANVLRQFGLNLSSEQVQSRNVAAVTVMATLSAFARPGERLDVTASSLGDARSLVGGTLLLAPLRGADARVYALAQGPLSVGGYRYDLYGNLVQKNHPTVGRVPGGAVVEADAPAAPLAPDGSVTFVLRQADLTTASRVALAVEAALGAGSARALDASRVQIQLPVGAMAGGPASVGVPDRVALLTRVENLAVEPGQQARVVVNERTGMVVAGGDVRISQVTISHGELKVSINTDYAVSQPEAALIGSRPTGARTVVVPRTRIDAVEEDSRSVSMPGPQHTVADLVKALGRLKTSPRDMISILQGMRTAGALHAELIIQ